MSTFNVYPKEGEMFSLEIHRFEIAKSGERFDLYNEENHPSHEGLVLLKNVAAIVPASQPEENCIQFKVYLKNNPSKTAPTFLVFAHAFNTTESAVIFKYQSKEMRHYPKADWLVPNVYLALSEVVAIIPADGLKPWRG